jgi:elongator complex protein 3
LRGAQFGYDARAITTHRLETLETLGHSTSKVEVIVMGGTFPARPPAYQETVFRGIFDGLNGGPSSSLAEAQRRNETAARRCVSLAVETRPDWCGERVLPSLLAAGVTRVEIGVECLQDDVLASVGRAHTTDQAVEATKSARDQGLKVCYHVMLGLPGMTPRKDLTDVRRMFTDPEFRPDMLKIYPTLVLPGTGLFDDWREGRYTPYDLDTAAELIADIKQELPPWVRIQRIQRDIPARLIAAGVRAGNLRQVAQSRLKQRGRACGCLRCREVGRRATPSPDRLEFMAREYVAGGGKELFLSWEDPVTDTIGAFLRLRIPSGTSPGGLADPVIRELKVLGEEIPVGEQSTTRVAGYQHRGLGRGLLERAAEYTRTAGHDRLYVLSAVGTRPYYRRLGFEGTGAHLAKRVFA